MINCDSHKSKISTFWRLAVTHINLWKWSSIWIYILVEAFVPGGNPISPYILLKSCPIDGYFSDDLRGLYFFRFQQERKILLSPGPIVVPTFCPHRVRSLVVLLSDKKTQWRVVLHQPHIWNQIGKFSLVRYTRC